MDAVSYAHSAKQAQRIKKFNENPDSTSGILTQPSVIQTGETVSIPAGRTAVMANTVINGTVNIDGTMFIPSGATTTDIDTKLSTKVNKVTSTDNAIVRFDGTTGAVQNSGVIVDDNGNIGIGTSPKAWYGDSTIAIEFGTSDGGTIWSSLAQSTSHIGIGANFYYDSTFTPRYKANTAAMSFEQSSGGYIWKTAPSGTAGNPITWTNAMSLDTSSSLLTYGSVRCGFNGISFQPSGATALTAYGGDGNNYVSILGRNTSDTTPIFLSLISGTPKSAIYANGNFGSATGVYGGISDAKLKENVVDTSPKLEKLMKIQVRNFNFIGQEDKQIGVIAQEIEQIFPSLIFETKDTKQVEVTKERAIPAVEEVTDEEGNVITEAKPESVEEYIETETQETGEVTKNVKYSVLYMIAIKALQELNAKVEAMQLEINELKGAN